MDYIHIDHIVPIISQEVIDVMHPIISIRKGHEVMTNRYEGCILAFRCSGESV